MPEHVEIRVLVPRGVLVAQAPAAPVLISQKNCHLFGLTERRFRDVIRRPDFDPEVLRLGKLRLVNANEFVAWLRQESTDDSNPISTAKPDSASRLASEMLGSDFIETTEAAE